MSDPVKRGRIGVILARQVTPIMQQVHSRLEIKANLSGDDESAI